MSSPRLLIAISGFSILAACGGLRDSMFRKSRIKPIVVKLHSPDPLVREGAAKELAELGKQGLGEGEGSEALRAATDTFPPGKFDWSDRASDLVSAARRTPRDSCVSVVKESFPRYSRRAQEEALRLLDSIKSRHAAETLVDCLRRSSEAAEPSEFRDLSASPRHPEVLFPALLDLAARPKLRWSILQLTLSYLKARLLRVPQLDERICQVVLPVLAETKPAILAHQHETGTSWMWADEYQATRAMTALGLDVLGHVPSGCARSELDEALAYRDTRLVLFAALGLLRSGNEVPPEAVIGIARSPECRNWFFRGLKEIGREDLFPREFRTQRAFAESEMVNWLIFPTELDRAPDEIELMAVIPTNTPAGPAEHYIFRFRTLPPHWAAEKGWMAGGAGPFLTEEGPTTEGGGDTFSTFTPWSSKTSEEHARELAGVIGEWRKSWERGR
jgi:hypothetical protein